LPSILIAGTLVVPSTARDRLLEAGPGRVLPSTRALVFSLLFALIVFVQWTFITFLIHSPRISNVWRDAVSFLPLAALPIAFMSENLNDIVRLASIPLWFVFILGTALQHWTKRKIRM